MNSEKLYEQGLEKDEKIIHLLPKMKQYPISRENFRTLFTGSLNMIIDELPFESDNFKIWCFDEDCYILHKESGILVSWYKLYHYTNYILFKKYYKYNSNEYKSENKKAF